MRRIAVALAAVTLATGVAVAWDDPAAAYLAARQRLAPASVSSRASLQQVLGTGDFELVLTDLTMPGMTGIQLARELIKTAPEVPIVICTGFNEGINREHLRNLGMQGFIMKPYSSEKLGSAIREVLDE